MDFDKLKNEIPSEITTRFTNIYTDTGRVLHGFTEHAAGGRPEVGVPTWIGERGKELWVPDVAGTIIPHGQAPAGAAVAGADMSETNALLREQNELLRELAADPSGQEFVAANLYKAISGAGVNRLRGLTGA